MIKHDLAFALNLERWKRDPVLFIREMLINPDTGRPFDLYPAQIRFLREALTPTPQGTAPYPEAVYSAPKKSGKTATAAIAMLYVVTVLGGPYAEGYCCANDFEQSQGRVFQAVSRIVQASPKLSSMARVLSNRIEFTNSASITAIASDYAGAAGANPTITCFDELWGYTSESARRLFDEMVPPPTRPYALRLTVTYAGFEGESELLEELYKRGMHGEQIAPALYKSNGLLMFWSHEPVAPWQTPAWLEQMRTQLRTNAYLRMIENRFVASESSFIPIEWWDHAATGTPVLTERTLPVVLGVDAGLKRDSAAVVACAFDAASDKVRLLNHRIFYPTPKEPLDIESTLEEAVREFTRRFFVLAVVYDPWQFQRSAQTLAKAHIPMVEYPQSMPNLTAMSTNLYELLKSGNLAAYPDDEIRLAMQRAIAVETARGMRIAKEKASHKIDVVVALAMAALGALEYQPTEGPVTIFYDPLSDEFTTEDPPGLQISPY